VNRLRRFLIAGALVLASCHPVSLNTARAPTWGSPHELRIGVVSDPYSLNPLFAVAQTSIDGASLYTETLVGLNDHNELIPLVAERVPSRANGDISSDGLSITYHLRRDERFADGVPLTSRDVAFTYHVIMDPRNPVSEPQPYHEIAALETPDSHTVRIRLRRPWAAAVSELFAMSDFGYGILPAHAFPAGTDIAHADWNNHPFGSGPFRVTAWRRGDEIVLEPNAYARRRPALRRLTIKIIPDRNSMFIALRTHTIDLADLTEEQVKQARALADVRVVNTPNNYTVYLEFQTQRAPTDDPLVRRAIGEAVDRDALLKNVFLGLYPPATTEIPPVLWAHDSALQPTPFDPKSAAADLDRAGWRLINGGRYKDGRPLQVEFSFLGTNQQNRRLATEVQAQLRAVGIDTVLRGYPSTLYYAPASAGGIQYGGHFNMAYGGWYGGTDPEQSESLTCDRRAPDGSNYSRFCNAEYDRLFAAQKVTFARESRRRDFVEMQRIVRANAIYDFLAYPTTYTAINPGLRNFKPNMLFEFWNSEAWDVP